jgi:hypothetical protein
LPFTCVKGKADSILQRQKLDDASKQLDALIRRGLVGTFHKQMFLRRVEAISKNGAGKTLKVPAPLSRTFSGDRFS